MSDGIQIDYPELVTAALRSVAAKILQRVSEDGLPSDHFFYLTLRTDHEGVEIPANLREQYPEELTIVLQNQFWDLYADDDRFAVNLRFGGVAHRLVVPFSALTAFVDPTADFALRFTTTGGDEAAEQTDSAALREVPESDAPSSGPLAGDEVKGATVVQLDNFRKR